MEFMIFISHMIENLCLEFELDIDKVLHKSYILGRATVEF